jgi:exodeoxyribonuclease V gamma subunit
LTDSSQQELNFYTDSKLEKDVVRLINGRGIRLYTSNDPEELIKRCGQDLGSPLSNPFIKEEFLVQSRGMSSWLKLQMADQLGVFANVKFRFPEETIWMILRGFIGRGPEKNPYTKEGMAWRIFHLLPELLKNQETDFSQVSRYLGANLGKEDANRSFRLCRQVATLYDSYLTYRPEMIMDWMAGKLPERGNRWQGVLWQHLRREFKEESMPELMKQLDSLKIPQNLEWLPERLSVFGISTLPPIFLDILQAYGRFRPLHFYVLQPAPVMWGDVESEKDVEKWKDRAIKRATEQSQKEVNEIDLGIESGNPLIGSLGRTGREFFNLLVDRDAHDYPLNFREPVGGTLLERLQRWTFEVFSKEPESRMHIGDGDESIVINSCHGPMREAEVLRDYLLRQFANDSTLCPKDVVVMMPDPEGYAPYIRATFEGMEKGMPKYFPISIVDREPRQESHLIDCFFNLIEFFDGRATNRDVLDLIDSSVFRKKFELEDEDVQTFRDWVKHCHVHWGLHAEHRERFGSTPSNQHTWRHALDRMALGFCMRSNGERMWDGVLPFDEIEGENTVRLGKLYRIVGGLIEFEEKSAEAKTLSAWAKFLEDLTDRFFPSDNDTFLDRRRVQDEIKELKEEYSELAGNSKVPLQVVRYHLSNVLAVGSPQGQFLTSGITFCGLRPMRSVSAKIICLLGMNDGAFPRQTRKLGFDLSGNRRAGDRSAREDDRYLFLETIWCAREHLYMSYVGQSIRQSQSIPPSVVINELLDSLDKLVDFGENHGKERKARDELISVQTLHPFGWENFTGGKIPRSYSFGNLQAASALLSPEKETQPFLSGQMSEPSEKINELTMDELIHFFQSPAKAFLKIRLGMSLWDEDSPPEECEPFELGSLEKYVIKDRLLGMALELEHKFDLLGLEGAKGSLPPGSLGEVWLNEAKRDVEEFVERWQDAVKGEQEGSVVIEEELDGVKLRGELGPFVNGRQVLYRCVKEPKGKDRISIWLRHLFASAFQEPEVETRFYSLDKKFISLEPLPSDSARTNLSNLIALYKRGMTQPLPFFPESSYAFARNQPYDPGDGKRDGVKNTENKGIQEAKKKWVSTQYQKGEGDDSANQLCFREEPFKQAEFEQVASAVYHPFLKVCEAGKGEGS